MSERDLPPELRDLAARLRTLSPDEWDPPAPPPLWAPREPRSRTGHARRGRGRRALVLRPAVAAAAAVALLAVGAGVGSWLAGGGSGADGAAAGRDVSLAPVGDGPRTAYADARLGAGTMRLTVSGLPRVPAGGFYEVWMLRDAHHLVALGSFRVGAGARVRVDLPVIASARAFPVLDISREPDDGDPAHSGASVLRSRPIHS